MSHTTEYDKTYAQVRKSAVLMADSDTLGIEQVAISTVDDDKGADVYCVRQPGGRIYVAVAPRATVVFGDRGPVGFNRALRANPHTVGQSELAGWFLRHVSDPQRHQCFYVSDAIEYAEDMSNPDFSDKEWVPCWEEVRNLLLENRYEVTLQKWLEFLECEGIEICDNAHYPLKLDFETVFCAQICVQVERWLYLQENS